MLHDAFTVTAIAVNVRDDKHPGAARPPNACPWRQSCQLYFTKVQPDRGVCHSNGVRGCGGAGVQNGPDGQDGEGHGGL